MSKKVLVVLDPGHYPKVNKGVIPGYYEGDKMYDFTEYEKTALESYGIDVLITRDRKKDMDLRDRGQVAVKNGKGYDEVVFISNHSNAHNGKASGVEIYRSLYLPKSEELGKKIAEAVVSVMKPATGVTYNRGVKTRKGKSGDYYGVIRGSVSGAKSEAEASKGPVKYSFIVEHGFHDNEIECKFLNDNSNLEKMAKVEAKAIAEYFGLVKSEVKNETPDELYRVRKTWADVRSQIGAYKVLVNAKDKADENPGYKVFDSSGKIVYTSGDSAKKSVDELAREVIAGKWGVGLNRKRKLTEAGYNYSQVQKRVNEILK